MDIDQGSGEAHSEKRTQGKARKDMVKQIEQNDKKHPMSKAELEADMQAVIVSRDRE